MDLSSGEHIETIHARDTMRRQSATNSPVMHSPGEPQKPAGSVQGMARRRDKHERVGMHVPSGQARPTRGGMTLRDMVRRLLIPICPCRSRGHIA